MDITIIHGQVHKGSTYHITELIKGNLMDSDTNVHEYFMIKDTPDFCVGCFKCILNGEQYCPHASKVQEIVAAMVKSDIIIIDSPTYCFEMSGQLKTLLDHFGYMWMSHRPRKEMFSKVGIAVSTAAGAGSKRVVESIEKQMFWWGIPKVYSMPVNVNAMRWEDVSNKNKEKITNNINATTQNIKDKIGNIKPGVKTKALFNIMRKMHTGNNWNLTDRDYWKNNDWLENTRPWR
jgi:multimeric flavodoxin WrbA